MGLRLRRAVFIRGSLLNPGPASCLMPAMRSDSAYPQDNLVILHDEAARRWLRFQDPVEMVSATRIDDVLPRLREIEQAVEQRGLHAAGWIAYEAAPAFDAALAVRESGPFPLLGFGLYEKPKPMDLPPAEQALTDGWRPDLPPEAYAQAFDRIKRHIREGDTYQVNFTFRLLCEAFATDPWQAFLSLAGAQRSAFGAYVAAGPWRICSASPELFFRLDGIRLESRPMKGTAPRGLSAAQDRTQAAALLASEKNRAENLMIVDMVRNDLGRIARPGTVQTTRLCELEKYPTLWQLTSAVAAETEAPVSEIFSAMFPPASITGAPKKRTMEIIADLEPSPRQIYTGAIGFLSPGRRAQFNVAIRTLLLDTRTRRAEYGTGGGIVWDSALDAEQAECRTKSRILAAPPRPPFSLLETMLWTPEDGIRLLELHLARMSESATYFDYAFDAGRVRHELESLAQSLPRVPHRLRLLLAEDGTPALQSSPWLLSAPPRSSASRSPAAPSTAPTSSSTTRRRTAASTKRPRPVSRITTTSFSSMKRARPPNRPSRLSSLKSTASSAPRRSTAGSSPAPPAPNSSRADSSANRSFPSTS